MSKQIHTKTPWRVNPKNGTEIETDYFYGIADCNFNRPYKEDYLNALHIVKCVNAHDELIKLLNEALEKLSNEGYEDTIIFQRIDQFLLNVESDGVYEY